MVSIPQVRINKRFPIIPRREGQYHSFPTLVRWQKALWLACRSGKVDSRQVHGYNGSILLFRAELSDPTAWHAHGILFSPSPDGSENEIDAILSTPDSDHVFLATRDFKRQRNLAFLSSWTELPGTDRVPLPEITAINAGCLVCYGHIQQTENNDLLMPAYGHIKGEKPSSFLLASIDHGASWQLRALVARTNAEKKHHPSEYTLAKAGNHDLVALVRNDLTPSPLLRVTSNDDGHTWSVPEATSLIGHAPMMITSSQGFLLAVYRDLAEDQPGFGLGTSLDNGKTWQRLTRLAEYQGNIYDGGYGDLIELADNTFLAAYYLSKGDGCPWIEGILFSL